MVGAGVSLIPAEDDTVGEAPAADTSVDTGVTIGAVVANGAHVA